MKQCVLWWGNFDADYSRNRIMQQTFQHLGWQINTFCPRKPRFSYIRARLQQVPRPDLIFVPSFCQKNIAAALCFSRHHNIPVMIDPLISLYDTRVFERKTVTAGSRSARKLLTYERRTFQGADIVIADTEGHADYFHITLGVARDRIVVIPVSAEEPLFSPQQPARQPTAATPEVLFYGSFLPLQGIDIIVEAIRNYQGPPVHWTLLGGKTSLHRPPAQRTLAGQANVTFEDDIPYLRLPARIHQSDIVLGVFGASDKTQRVIPNKVYQALACGRPVISCEAPYPKALPNTPASGLIRIPAASAPALASAVAQLAAPHTELHTMGQHARHTYECFFDNRQVQSALTQALQKAGY